MTGTRASGAAERVRLLLDSLVARAKTPGVQYLFLRPEGAVLEHAAGWADLGRRVPMDAATTMMAYSMSKTVTAAAVLQLVEAGTVGLGDPLARWVDSSPYGPDVTVRQLLSHTSGIPNPVPLRWVHPAERHATFDEAAALAAVLRDHPRLARRPGTRYAYSNIGYWLLGRLVERAGGASFTDIVRERVLRPLGIEPRELDYSIHDPGRHATGYLEKWSFMNLAKRLVLDAGLIGEYSGPWLSIRSHYVNGAAFGGLVGTASGFGRFLADQLGARSRLFGEGARRLFYEPQRVADGTPVAMTLGWHVGALGGHRCWYKEGGGGGFHSMMRVYPDASAASVVMVNATGFDVARCLDALDAGFLAGGAVPVPMGPEGVR